jgi:hypothetical protein
LRRPYKPLRVQLADEILNIRHKLGTKSAAPSVKAAETSK